MPRLPTVLHFNEILFRFFCYIRVHLCVDVKDHQNLCSSEELLVSSSFILSEMFQWSEHEGFRRKICFVQNFTLQFEIKILLNFYSFYSLLFFILFTFILFLLFSTQSSYFMFASCFETCKGGNKFLFQRFLCQFILGESFFQIITFKQICMGK